MMSKIVWKGWDPQRVKAGIAEQVAKNMEVACRFVQVQARANLMSIVEPRFWLRYRQRFLAPKVAYEIEISENAVEGRIGIEQARHRRGGYFIEIGRKNLPAHPWLRPAVFNNAREIALIIAGK